MISRMVLTIGELKKEAKYGAKFLNDETGYLREQNEQAAGQEGFHNIPDKWGGDKGMKGNIFKRLRARKQGSEQYGRRKSFKPKTGAQKHLRNLGEGEELKIVAHGSNDSKIGGYTGTKLANLLIKLGLEPRHQGDIRIHGCVAAQRESPDKLSAIEEIKQALQAQGYKNEVWGVRGLMIASTPSRLRPYGQKVEQERPPGGTRADDHDRQWLPASELLKKGNTQKENSDQRLN